MKKISWLIILTLVISLVLPGLGSEGGLALAADTLRVAKFIATQGDVKVLRAGGEKPFPAFKGMGLTQGDTVVTGKDGQATLEVAEDKEMKIAKNTRLMISELVQSLQDNADKTSFYLKAGQVYTNVKKTLAPGAKYEIRTPTAVMGVRGTQFFVNLSNGLAQVVTLEGQVTVTISQQVTGDDGTVTTQNVEIQVQPNQIFVQSGSETGPTQYNLETITSNDNLSLFVLETLQEINEQQPGLIDAQLLEDLAEQIEEARQEEEQELQEYEQEQQDEDNQDNEGSGSDNSSGDGGGNDDEDESVEITIALMEDLNLDIDEDASVEIISNPDDVELSVSVGDEAIAEAYIDQHSVYVIGRAAGETEVTVTASKSGYLEGTQSFTVTVSQGDSEEDITIESIDDLSLAVGDEDTVEIYTDPEDADLAVEVENESIAEANLDGGTIYISGLSAGSTTITVTAEKEGYSPGEESFTVTVSQGVSGLEIQSQALAAGETHSLVVEDGYVYYSGYDGVNTTSLGLSIVPGLTDVVAVSANKDYSLALNEDGEVWAWGENGIGQLGNGSNYIDSLDPTQVYGLSDIVAVSAGECHALALKNDGTVWAWGDNSDKKLGIDSEESKTYIPQKVKNEDGSYLSGIVAIGAGYAHSLALKEDGTVWAWGDNNSVQLGQGAEGNDEEAYPVQVKDTSGTGYLTDVTAIAAGPMHNLALDDGKVWAWGYNNYGQLGIGEEPNIGLPEEVVIMENEPLTGITKIAAGGNWAGHSLALDSSGRAYSWGNGDYGQLGLGYYYERKTTPVQVPGLASVTSIAAGGEYGTSLFLEADGTVKACGFNDCGELGDGTQSERISVVTMIQFISPTTPPQLEDIIIHNYATGADNVRVFDHIGGGLYKAYNASEDGDLIGQEYGIDDDYVYINIDDGFESSLSNVYITATDIDMEKPESSRTAVEIPLPKLQENIDFAVDISENGLGRISFDVSETQASALAASLGEENLVIRAFVGKEENSTIETLPALDDSNVDIIVIEPGQPEGIGRKPGQYPYAVAVYDEAENVLAQYLNDNATAVIAFESIDPDEVFNSVEFTESFTLTLKAEESTEFDAGIDTGDFTLEGAFDPSLSVIALEYCGSKEIMILISGSQTATGEGIIKISQEALNEGEDNSEADLYATVQIMEAY